MQMSLDDDAQDSVTSVHVGKSRSKSIGVDGGWAGGGDARPPAGCGLWEGGGEGVATLTGGGL